MADQTPGSFTLGVRRSGFGGPGNAANGLDRRTRVYIEIGFSLADAHVQGQVPVRA